MPRKRKANSSPALPSAGDAPIESNGVAAQIADTTAPTARPVRRPRKPKEVPNVPHANGEIIKVPHCVSAADVTLRSVEWIWEGYVPYGAVSLVVGPSHVGKTTFMTALAADLTTGQRLDGKGKRTQSNVLWYVTEEGVASMTRPKLQAAGAVLGKIWFPGYDHHGHLKKRLHLPNDLKDLRFWIEDKGASAVFFDPLNSFLGDGFDTHKSDHVRPLMELLGQLADELHIGIVATLHLRKDRSGSPLEWIAGSAAWHQTARVALALGSDPEAPSKKVLTVAKNSLGRWLTSKRYDLIDKGGHPRFLLGPDSHLQAHDLVASTRDAGDRDALNDARMFLRYELQDEEKPARELERRAEENGIRPATLRRAKKAEGVTSHAIGPNERRYLVWRHPEGGFKGDIE